MKVKEIFGFIPTSVFRLGKKSDIGALRKPDFSKTSRSSYSGVPLDLVVLAYNLYCGVENGFVLNPFSGFGHFSICSENYIGCDVSPVNINIAKYKFPNGSYVLTDSRNLPFPNETFDYAITSPPYWNIEKYESVPGQLSDISKYDTFMVELRKVFKEVYRVLKFGARFSLMVANFRKRGKFYSFVYDVHNMLIDIGFRFHDEIVVDKSVRYPVHIFAEQAIRKGYTVKVHEFLNTYEKGG